MISARSTPNIALIKYWGNRNDDMRLPMTDSLSMTLNEPHVAITVDHADVLSVHSFKEDGTERMLNKENILRFQNHLELTKHFLLKLGISNAIPAATSINIHSGIPPAIGLASSAAVFSCLAKTYAGLVQEKIKLTDEQISVIARLGSGSAARSIFGGYSALFAGKGEEMDSAFSAQIANEEHWKLYDVIIVPSHEEKEVGSTDGHKYAHASPHFIKRVEAIRARRQQECIDAILQKDFEKLQKVSEEDCMDMHHVMQTSTPALNYLSKETYRIIDEITLLREEAHLPVLYTMDAGPTVHLFCTEEALGDVREFAKSQNGTHMYETYTGPGTHLISAHGSPLPATESRPTRAL